MRTAMIEAFLRQFRKAVKEGRFTLWHDRPDHKNSDTMILLQYTIDDATKVFMSLKRDDYKEGPVQDNKNPEDESLWVFHKIVEGYNLYMKIKHIASADWYIGISFHVSER